MRLNKAIVITVALLVMMLGVQSLVAMEKERSSNVNLPMDGSEGDGNVIEGDPWQDDDGDDPWTVSDPDKGGISGIVFMRPSIGSWNPTGFWIFVKIKLGFDDKPRTMETTVDKHKR